MKLRPLTCSDGRQTSCLCADGSETAEELLSASVRAEFLAVNRRDPDAEPVLEVLQKALGAGLLVSELWQDRFPGAGVLISSAISGGDLRTRFRDAAEYAPGRCVLLLEPICIAISLPSLDGQGQETRMPREPGFYSEALGCRYIHRPGQAVLFDTEESLAVKCRWAMEAGFSGWISTEEK